MISRKVLISLALCSALGATSCRSTEAFTTAEGERFEGRVVQGSFVRSGFGAETLLCLTLNASRLSDAPGFISTSDGRFKNTALRPIPQLFHDPLSTLSFGEGRSRNLMYVARGETADAVDATMVVSLMESEQIEVRVLRGAPGDDRAAAPLFGVFLLQRERGACSF